MKPGQLYVFRKDIVVDNFAYTLTTKGFASVNEIKIPLDCVALYLREYKTSTRNQWSVFLFGEQIGVSMTKYFKQVPRSRRVKS